MFSFIHKNEYLCGNCRELFAPKFINFNVKDYKALALYEYDETIKTYLYQFKGCYDYELYPVFLYQYINEIRLLYLGYTVIPIPSYEEENEERGFNHVEEIFSLLRLPTLKILEKTEKFKQAKNTAKEREGIKDFLKVKEKVDLSDKKVLLVDDVYTTGSTMKTAIDLVEKLHPKDIKILVMSKATLIPV